MQEECIEQIRANISGLEHKRSQIQRLEQEINKLVITIEEQLRQYVYETRRDMFLSTHTHYTQSHRLVVNKRFYYDYSRCGSAYYDKYGREIPYGGPTEEVIIVCEQCGKEAHVYTYAENDDVNIADEFNTVLLDDIYANIKQIQLEG